MVTSHDPTSAYNLPARTFALNDLAGRVSQAIDAGYDLLDVMPADDILVPGRRPAIIVGVSGTQPTDATDA